MIQSYSAFNSQKIIRNTYNNTLNFEISIDGQPHSLLLSTTSGSEDNGRLLDLYYRINEVFLVCFSVVDPVSFKNVKKKVCLILFLKLNLYSSN